LVVVFVPALWNLIFFFTAEGAENAEEERKRITRSWAVIIRNPVSSEIYG
jgi:hypothetical protein